MKICSIENCNNIVHAKNLCHKHYKRLLKYGVVNKTRFDKNKIIKYQTCAEVILYNIKCKEIARTLIDLDEIDLVKQYKWHLAKTGYTATRIDKKQIILLHKLIMNEDNGLVVDHINRNKLDNRKCNLRYLNRYQHAMNMSKKKNNTSGIVGVDWNKKQQKWRARIKYNGKYINLGSFNKIEDAKIARMNGVIKYHGEYRGEISC